MPLRYTYLCPSETCRHEIEIDIPLGTAAGKAQQPICICGAKMKKAYTTPVLFRLSKAEVVRHLRDSEEAKYASP